MNDLAVWVLGWNETGNDGLAERLRAWGKVPNVFTYCNYGGGEPENYNHCIRESERMGFQYIMALDSDVEIIHTETIPAMYEWINTHEKAGSIRPWRKGEPAQSQHYPPEVKYVEDSTAMLWRIGIGVYMDEEFAYTGWCDLDLGLQLEQSGYQNYNDRRYPVMHNMDGSNSHSRSSVLQAIKKRNKLLLDFKWYKVGIKNWRGVDSYNRSVPIDERIPTVNQIVAMSNESQELFQQSVSPEHAQIWHKDGRVNPNLSWRNPLVVGYSTREKFEKEYGYS